MKKNKGITLIALIITIVIMLILLGLGTKIIVDNKIFTKTQIAVNKTNNRIKNDDAETNYLLGELDNTKQKQCSHISIKMQLTHQDIEIPTDTTKYTLTSENVPIPTGYYYVGGTKDTGIVISDSANDANKGDSHEVANTLQGNQFVWVPVLQNQKIKIDIVADQTITSLELIDPNGKTITTPTPSGKTYTASVDPTINGIYMLKAETAEEKNTVALEVYTLYARGFDTTLEEIKASADQNEISVEERLTWYYSENTFYIDNYNISDTTVSLYKNSVDKYGGFYIARYEAGCEIARTNESDTTDTVYSKQNMYPYNYISQTDSITKAATIASGKTSVTAGLINAAGWNRTLHWLLEKQKVTENEIVSNSTSWGNYYESKFSFIGKYSLDFVSFSETSVAMEKPENEAYLLGTGVSNYTCKNNIYDLGGNLGEWTTEGTDTTSVGYYVVYRGRFIT